MGGEVAERVWREVCTFTTYPSYNSGIVFFKYDISDAAHKDSMRKTAQLYLLSHFDGFWICVGEKMHIYGIEC